MFARAAALAMLPLTMGLQADVQGQGSEPTCRAFLKGGTFITSFELANGYRLEARWQLSFVAPPAEADPSFTATDLRLQSLTEADSTSGKKTAIRVADPWRLGTVGRHALAALDEAVDVWCRTMVQATSSGVRFGRLALARPGRPT